MYSKIKEKNAPKAKQEKNRKFRFKKTCIVFLFIGIILLWRHNVIEVKIITSNSRVTMVGEGVFIQTYKKCIPRAKITFNLSEGRFVSKTETGYLIRIPKFKSKLKIVTLRPKITIMSKNIFVQSLKPCLPRMKLIKDTG